MLRIAESAVADADAIRGTARILAGVRDAGNQVIGVVVAPETTRAELLALAHDVSPAPRERELDMLVSMSERTTCALTAMALRDLGYEAVSLTGSQAGIVTDTRHGGAKIVEVRPDRVREVVERGAIALVAGFQGVSGEGEVTTFEREGPDQTALALAAVLDADVRDIEAASARATGEVEP